MMASAQVSQTVRVVLLRNNARTVPNAPLSGFGVQSLMQAEIEHIERCMAARLDSYQRAFEKVGIIPSEEDLRCIWEDVLAVQQTLINQTAGGLKHFFKPRVVDFEPTGGLTEGSAHGHDRVLEKWKIWRTAIQIERGHFEISSTNSLVKEQRVWVVHGRDERLRFAMFTFLRSIGLEPLEFSQARNLTHKASPYIGEILDAAFQHAQAVIVLLTPDDEARLRTDLLKSEDQDYERHLTGQARPNVLFEAGMALVSHPDKTVLVQIGDMRPFSDVAGRLLVHMDGSMSKRQDIAQRLITAGCRAVLSGTDWHTAGDFSRPLSIAKSSAVNPQLPPKSEPNLHFGDVGLRQIHLSVLDKWETSADGKTRPYDSVVVEVRNEPQECDVADAYIKGQLIFKGPGGSEYRANPCAWINEEYDTVKIKSGKSKYIVAAVYSPSKCSTITNLRDNDYPQNKTAMEFIPLPPVNDYFPLEIVLVDYKSGRRLKNLSCEWRWGLEHPTFFIKSRQE
jgi:predicted nucleotide-binding protein